MEPMIIDGKLVSQKVKNTVKMLIQRDCEQAPKLAILTFGEDDASKIYVKNKLAAADEVGIKATNFRFTFEEYMSNFWEKLDNICKEYDGIILQLPVPTWVDKRTILSKIPSEKDVDGLTTTNIGLLQQQEDCLEPCTPAGIIELLNHYFLSLDFEGKHAVVIGRSLLVGRPIAAMLLDNNMTVTICHSKTKNLKKYTQDADILICAAGTPNLITADMVKEGVVIVDVSMNRNKDNKLCGDVDFQNVAPKCKAITPVPGGVGPMTVAMLMFNTYLATAKKI